MTVYLINSNSLVRESALFLIYEPNPVGVKNYHLHVREEDSKEYQSSGCTQSSLWILLNPRQFQPEPTALLFSTGCTSADFGSKKWMVPLVHRFGDRKTAQVLYFLFQNITDVHSHQNNTTQLMCSRPPTHGLSLKVFFVIARIYK